MRIVALVDADLVAAHVQADRGAHHFGQAIDYCPFSTFTKIVRRIRAGQTEDDEGTRELRNSSFDTDDYAEGVRTFLEKRPVFTRS